MPEETRDQIRQNLEFLKFPNDLIEESLKFDTYNECLKYIKSVHNNNEESSAESTNHTEMVDDSGSSDSLNGILDPNTFSTPFTVDENKQQQCSVTMPRIRSRRMKSPTRSRTNSLPNSPKSSRRGFMASSPLSRLRKTFSHSNLQLTARDWTVDQVCDWLCGLGQNFVQYTISFRQNGVNGRCLLEDLDDVTINDLVYTNLHKKRILNEIADLKSKDKSAPPSPNRSNSAPIRRDNNHGVLGETSQQNQSLTEFVTWLNAPSHRAGTQPLSNSSTSPPLSPSFSSSTSGSTESKNHRGSDSIHRRTLTMPNTMQPVKRQLQEPVRAQTVKSFKHIKKAYPQFATVLAFIQIPIARNYFKQFLKRRFCSENLLFWIECEEYKEISFPNKRTYRYQKIYKKYLEENAELEVNLPAKIQKDLVAAKDHHPPPPDLFLKAQKNVLKLLRLPFSEFLLADEYHDYKKYQIEHNELDDSDEELYSINSSRDDSMSADFPDSYGSEEGSRRGRFSEDDRDSDGYMSETASLMGLEDDAESEWLDFLEKESDNIIISELERKNFLIEAAKGVNMTKHGRKGNPKLRRVRIVIEQEIPLGLTWKGTKPVPFMKMRHITSGKKSAVLKRPTAKAVKDEQCFSIFLTEEEKKFKKSTIDFQLGSQEERDKWVNHLNEIIREAKYVSDEEAADE